MKQFLRRLMDLADQTSIRLVSLVRPRLFTRLFYGFFNPRFGRENRVIAAGRASYLAGDLQGRISMLRRNTHRIEKGLTMRPMHAIFGDAYILETVKAYRQLQNSPDADLETLRWAHDVFVKYFSVVSDTPEVSEARALFRACHPIACAVELTGGQASWAPVARSALPKSTIQYQEFFTLCRQRRSIRWFLPQAVPRESIENAIAVALQAPSACNRQPFFFKLFLNSVDASEIASIAMGTTGYQHQIPALMVVIGDWSCLEHERDRHVPYIDGSLAAMQLMLALETLGLSSCPINWPDVEPLEKRMTHRLKLQSYERPIMLLAVGYADPTGGVAYSAKKTLSTTVRETRRRT